MPEAGPIADLSYRTYDGVLDPPTQRWKVIAKMTMMRVARVKMYWVLCAFSGWYYGVMMVFLFIMDTMLSQGPDQQRMALDRLGGLDWTAQFLNGYSFGQLMFMFIALMAGAAAIANDNRSNALLVYLSKPCTKKDYIIGKWVGVFVPIAVAMLLPALFFWIFGALNYREFGFLTDDPWLLVKMVFIVVFGAAFQASIALGVSSLFNQGRLAGATYVGIYFITNIITVVMKVILGEAHDAPDGLRRLSETLFYCSIDGVNIGIAKIILGIDGAQLFGQQDVLIDRPHPLIAFGGMLLIGGLAMRLVWKRVRAVEVVK